MAQAYANLALALALTICVVVPIVLLHQWSERQ